ncbi:MAG: chloride channel protein [Rubrivivax sp.]
MIRPLLRRLRRALGPFAGPWLDLVLAAAVGVLGALAVAAFRTLLFGAEALLVHASGGHLVAAADRLAPAHRLLAPAVGALAAGLLLWLARRAPAAQAARPPRHQGDYIEAVAIGDGRLDVRAGLLKACASLLVVSTGGAVGREGAMVLLAALLASGLGRLLGQATDLRLLVSCGAAAGLAAAYHAPLAAAVFVAEILLGSLALARLGPVVVAAVLSHATTIALGGSATLYVVPPLAMPGAAEAAPLVVLGLIGGLLGAGMLRWLEAARGLFIASRLPLPLAFLAGGLVVGALSLVRPEVWGNGYSSIQQQLETVPAWQWLAAVLVLKLVAIAATTGSGAPGGVFTPTLFVGAAVGGLAAAAAAAIGLPAAAAPVYTLVGMAVLLAGTTHAPVMAALMVFEISGQYALLPVLLAACVLATLVSRRLHPRSVYGIEAAEGPNPRP